MNPKSSIAILIVLAWAFFADPTGASADIVIYDFENVSLSTSAQPMTGSFSWTFVSGDFENGSGELISYGGPGFNPALSDIGVSVGLDSIELTLIPNLDSRAFDINIKFDGVLSLDQPVAIDLLTSKYEILFGPGSGIFTNGNIVPQAVPEPATLWGFCFAGVALSFRRNRKSRY